MKNLIPSDSDDSDSYAMLVKSPSMNGVHGRLSHHFLYDPKAKFILASYGDVLNANIEASNLLNKGILFRLPEGKLSYGSSDMNNAVEHILEQLRFGRSSCIKLLKRFEDDWMVLEFSSASFNANKEVLLTIFPRRICQDDSLEALSKAFGFTITESEVVSHMSMALCPKEIGQEMDISTNTVRAHLRSIYSKTGVRGYNRALCLILQLTH